MSIDHMQSDSFSLPLVRPSHRTRPEQVVGLLIFFLFSFAVALFLNVYASASSWYERWIQASWAISGGANGPIWILYHLFLPLSMWTLWRRYSLRALKLELSIYLSQFAFQLFWHLSFFALQESLLALVALLLLWCNQLLAMLLFWKKERLSGALLIPPFIWVFYTMALHMMICISNP